MTSRYSTVVRMLGLALLLLAVSPVTAPFSTFDLVGLLCGTTAPAGGSLNGKKAPEEPAAEAGGRLTPVIVQDFWARVLPHGLELAGGRASLQVPLRI
jgi:hypothetical protein